MAEEEQLELKPQGGKKKLLLLVGVVLVLLIGGVGGWLMLSGGGEEEKEHAKKEDGGHAQSEEEKAAAQAAKMAMYVVLPRPFVFNVAAKPRYRLVQIKVALMVRGPANEALAKLHTPLVEGAMFRVFAASTTQQLESVDGRSKLRSDALAAVRQSLHEVTQQDVVEQVLFTGFVMQ